MRSIDPSIPARRIRSAAAALAVVVGLLAISVATAHAAAPAWTITAVSEPTSFHPGDETGDDAYIITATNTGDAPTDGSTITVSDALPESEGLTVDPKGIIGTETFTFFSELPCTTKPLGCTFSGVVAPGDALQVTVFVDVSSSAAASVVDSAIVSGGGAPSASAMTRTPIGDQQPAFGASGFISVLSTTQAGAHPNITTSFNLNQDPIDVPVGSPKNIEVDLPPGLVGNPTAVPRCNMNDVVNNECPSDTAVGVATVTLDEGPFIAFTVSVLVYNIAPYADEPAAFAFNAVVLPVRLDASVRSNGDYGVRVSIENATEANPFSMTSVTLWGVPDDNNGPGPDSTFLGQSFGGPGSGVRQSFLTNPTICGNPLTTNLTLKSWQEPNTPGQTYPVALGSLSGCEKLSFAPLLSVQPDTTQADEPSGYTVDLKVPQNENPNGLGTPELRNATVTMPAGVSISPSAADGLQGCSEAQIAFSSTAPGTCPSGSQIGTVKVITPLLTQPLEGQVFVGTPNCAPCSRTDAEDGNLFHLFLEAEGSGVVVKLLGKATVDPNTGQINATFANNPQLPFNELVLHFDGGPRATLANPQTCGAFTTESDLTPWSSPFTPERHPSSTFDIDWDGNGGACPGMPFSPSFLAQTAVPIAGGFSPFTLTLGRSDRQQDLQNISVQTPPGLLGMLSRVSLCEEPQAALGDCPAGSQIGETTVASGAGSHPFYVSGPVYLTGPYGGGPFGLTIAVHAVAGPFDLGTEIVRAAIHVDPKTSQLTVVSAPLPQIIDGVPLRLQTVNVTINRPGFIFNPTNCAQQRINATVGGAQGASVAVSSPFEVGGCQNLPFTPKFSVSSQGKTTRANGASLHVVVTSGPGQANIGKVAVSLPKQLPSRLTTIQKACPEATFAANPASCPAGSNIGIGKAVTPVLGVPLSGPAYLVSHGGAAFPDLDVVLSGEGVTVELTGSINITKAGITSSSFASVPDVPITRFDLELPTGPHSALTADLPAKAKGSLCGQKLTMPTTITGQNGAQVKQTTKIGVTGCPRKHKVKKKAKKKK